jgi:hypothetical protein
MQNKELDIHHKQVGTQLANLEEQVSMGETKIRKSFFFQYVERLVARTEIMLRNGHSFLTKSIWEERNTQVQILRKSLKIAELLSDDQSLFIDCCRLNKSCTYSWWVLSAYNEFPACLKEIITNYSNQLNKSLQEDYIKLHLKLSQINQGQAEVYFQQAKIEYAKQLETNPNLRLIEETLDTNSNQILQELLLQITSMVEKDLEELKKYMKEEAAERDATQRNYEESYARLNQVLEEQKHVIEAYKEKHPFDYQYDKLKEAGQYKQQKLEKTNSSYHEEQNTVDKGQQVYPSF